MLQKLNDKFLFSTKLIQNLNLKSWIFHLPIIHFGIIGSAGQLFKFDAPTEINAIGMAHDISNTKDDQTLNLKWCLILFEKIL